MTTMTSNRPQLQFPVRSRLTVVRDLAMVALCAIIAGGFLAQVWNAPVPEPLRSATAAPAAPRA
jgi:hypothetical protein